jgi:hypothetical protein
MQKLQTFHLTYTPTHYISDGIQFFSLQCRPERVHNTIRIQRRRYLPCQGHKVLNPKPNSDPAAELHWKKMSRMEGCDRMQE